MIDRYDQDLLLGYLEGDLDPAARAQVDQLLASDPPLAALMQSLAHDRAQLRAVPAEDVPGDLSFDLVQGLERRMLLDAPQVEPAGPIPIQRGHGMPTPTGGPRWGRIVGLTGMAAAIAMAAGLVVWFDQANPLSKTAHEMSRPDTPGAQPSGDMADGEESVTAHVPPSAERGHNMRGGRGAAANPAAPPDPLELETPADGVPNVGDPGGNIGAPGTPGGAEHEADGVAPGALMESSAPERTPPTLTLTAHAPDQALRIETDDPGTSKAHMLAWCVRNGVPIVEPKLDVPEELAADAEPQIAMLIEQAQLDELVEDLNRVSFVQQANRQRAVLDQADEAYYPTQRRGPVQAEAFADNAADDVSPAMVELQVAADLGDAEQTRQNFDNTLVYSNRAELARVAQRDSDAAEQERRNQRPAADAPQDALAQESADTQNDSPADASDDSAPAAPNTLDGQDRAEVDPDNAPADPVEAPGEGGAFGPAVGGEPMPHAGEEAPFDGGPAERQRRDPAQRADGADAVDSDHEGLPPAAPRGNWLLPQVPLAPSTPIWADTPPAQLVPIIIVRRMLEEADAHEPEATPAPPDDPDTSPEADTEEGEPVED